MADVTVVCGLAFGDEGKGSIVDHLARENGARLVVRYNGGAQAAHNVVCDRGHHTFAQFGAGTLAGAATHLSRFVCVNPLTMLNEAAHLRTMMPTSPWLGLTIEEGALITTPWHMVANRLLEEARGHNRHGSCGMGIGETMRDSIDAPDDVVRAHDLLSPTRLLAKLQACRDRNRRKVKPWLRTGEREAFDSDRHLRTVYAELLGFGASVGIVGPSWLDEQLRAPGHVIFEGAQGALLDQAYGYKPHVTFSDCTQQNFRALLQGRKCRTIGVTRAYLTRHGAGPLPSEAADFDPLSADDHNRLNAWQGRFRSGALDLVLLRAGLRIVGHVDELAVTCLDRIDRYGSRIFPVVTAHGGERTLSFDRVTGLPHDSGALTHEWLEATPESVVHAISQALDVPVGIRSFGPAAKDKTR